MKAEKKTRKRRKRNRVEECAYCGAKAAHPVLLNHTFGAGVSMIVVTNVETMICDNCGQSYFKGDVLKMLDKVLANPREYATKELVDVASLSAV